MDLVLDTAAAVERHRQSCWLHELHVEAKRLQKQAQEAQRHYTATLSTLKSLAHTYENINCLLVSVSRYFSEVSIGSRIGVGTNVEKFKNLVTTMEESPQCKKLQVLLKKQIDDADELKALVKRSFGALKTRDRHHRAFASAQPSATQRSRQLEAEVELGKEVRYIYAAASWVLDKECIGFVRAFTGGASAVIQLVQDRYTRSLLAATDAVGASHGYSATGVVQNPTVSQETRPTTTTATAVAANTQSTEGNTQAGRYGLNDSDYVSQPGSDVPVAMQPPSPMLPPSRQQTDAGVVLRFVKQ